MRKCYQRTDAHRLLDMLGRYIASEDVMYLARFLVSTYGGGLNIGSHLSMMLETWYLSNLYHFIEDRLFKERRGTRKRLAAHFLMYMDDILLMGPDKRDLKMAARMVERYAREEPAPRDQAVEGVQGRMRSRRHLRVRDAPGEDDHQKRHVQKGQEGVCEDAPPPVPQARQEMLLVLGLPQAHGLGRLHREKRNHGAARHGAGGG